MKNAVWSKAVKSSADPQRARHYLDLLSATSAGLALQKVSDEQALVLAALFSGSQALADFLVLNPDWLHWLEFSELQRPRIREGLRAELERQLKAFLANRDYAAALAEVRRFKQRQMLRIAARDLARLANVVEVTREISDVADVCLGAVWNVCHRQFVEKHGEPYHLDAHERWQPTGFCVLGMGKLGGQELNYSSDVDVLFVYSEEGQVFREPPGRSKSVRPLMASHQFFNRHAEAFIAEVTRMTHDGTLYRMDVRLRPEGDTGPLSRSLPGYENYYAQWGQTWERMMLIKARHVAGDASLAAEFLETIQPFRYPRSISEGVLHEVGAMKDRIENEVVRSGELERNVKLGHGGIREIEFIVQSQQLLHAGKHPFLQGAQTLPALEKLAQYNLLARADVKALADAYSFLRDVEHRLQMEANLQTHTISTERHALERLARLMGFRTQKEFEAARRQHTRNVRRIFDATLKTEHPQRPSGFPSQFDGQEGAWKELLARHSFKDVDKAFRVLREFVEGPGYVHVSPRTMDLAYQLLPKLFAMCPQQKEKAQSSKLKAQENSKLKRDWLSDPDRVVTRLDNFIAAYGARATLFELWHSNAHIFELLILLFDRSEFLAELAIRTPDLVDELVMSGRLRQRKTAQETLRDLRHGIEDEDQHLWLRRYHQAELMRIGLRDILGLADPEQYLTELSALADACLQYALEVTMRKRRLRTASVVIIGLGKLGGAEIDYGSDLDIVFIADNKAKDLTKLTRIAVEVMDLVSKRTEAGLPFHTDARLRPDGEKGLLVNTLAAYEEYYRHRAQLWEIQSLTRTRSIAGDKKLGEQFQRLAATLTNFSCVGQASSLSPIKKRRSPKNRDDRDRLEARPTSACFTSDWKQKIHQMRMRIEKERTPAGKDELAIKTGKGGLVDAEFIAQALCLEHGWQEANTVRALERGRAAKVLPDAGRLIASYRQLRRVEGILRRWSYEGETVLPDDPAPYYRVSVRCGFETPETFRDALREWRRAMRQAYLEVFTPK
jgi:glutamate-ammonia-ligase adenylyltransferase